MSMDVCLRLLLYSLLLPFIRAGPLYTVSLTPYLAETQPTCAQACLDSFITENFPSSVCSRPLNFGCLCSSASVSGFTIGEGALRCLVSTCPQSDESEAEAAYSVCRGINNARPDTHSTITATRSAAQTVGAHTPTLSGSHTNSNTQHSRSPSGSQKSSISFSASSTAHRTDSANSTATNSLPLPTSSIAGASFTSASTSLITPATSSTSFTAAPASSSAVSPPSPVLTKPQIAGVVVAGVGAVALGFGFCFLLCFFRRRKVSRRHSGSSFGGDKILDSHDSTPDMAATAVRDFGRSPQQGEGHPSGGPLTLITPAHTGEGGWSQWSRRNTAPVEIGLGVGPEAPKSALDEHSPNTPASYRTTSQLLPDKPIYSLFPPPLRFDAQSKRASQVLQGPRAAPEAPSNHPPASRSAPRFPSSMDTSQAHLQSGSDSRSRSSDPFYDPKIPSLQVYSSTQASRPRPGSGGYRGVPWTQPAETIRKPLPAHQSPSARGLWPTSSREQQPSLPKIYPPPPPIEDHYLAAIHNSHRRKVPPRRKSNKSNASTHFSNGSETSFEDADVDDLPEPVSALSPVAEVRSPARQYPRGQVTYPSVPTSAAESPTLRANRYELPARSDSLVAKRRGNEKAGEMSSGLLPNNHVRDTAKWKILVSPGLEDINSNPTSRSPRSARGVGRTPSLGAAPTRR